MWVVDFPQKIIGNFWIVRYLYLKCKGKFPNSTYNRNLRVNCILKYISIFYIVGKSEVIIVYNTAWFIKNLEFFNSKQWVSNSYIIREISMTKYFNLTSFIILFPVPRLMSLLQFRKKSWITIAGRAFHKSK